jgi:hypothetical protein
MTLKESRAFLKVGGEKSAEAILQKLRPFGLVIRAGFFFRLILYSGDEKWAVLYGLKYDYRHRRTMVCPLSG